MSFFDSPVAKRTRHQWELFYQSLHETSSRNQARKRNRETGVSLSGSTKEEIIDLDDEFSDIMNKDVKTGGSEGFCRSTRIKVDEVKKVDESLLKDEVEEKKDLINGGVKHTGVKEAKHNNWLDLKLM